MRRLKWLIPGMGIKRWILLCVLGIALTALGAVLIFEKGLIFKVPGLIVLLIGAYLTIVSIREMIRFIISMLLPQREKELVDIVYAKRQLSKGPRIVAIGGGTGLSVLLHGLKEYTGNISAVVTVTDDGGSSGRLRKEFDVLPPGDIRNCLVALADAEPLMRDLFQYRFDKKSQFKGHNFGNLFITVMSKLTGDFDKAVKASSKVLAIRGQVIPSTLRPVTLVARHKSGKASRGETHISQTKERIDKIFLNPPHCKSPKEAIDAIKAADAVVLGPGSLYTSIVPNLLIKEMQEAISKSKAVKIYICNVMTQSHETDGYSASDHLKTIINHTRPNIIDYCVINTQDVSEEFLKKYKKENASPVKIDSDKIRQMGYRVIEENIIDTTDFVRHSSKKLAKIIIDIISGKRT
jgi:uncharacterized cofD-like protein